MQAYTHIYISMPPKFTWSVKLHGCAVQRRYAQSLMLGDLVIVCCCFFGHNLAP